jgi:hypothetical protein
LVNDEPAFKYRHVWLTSYINKIKFDFPILSLFPTLEASSIYQRREIDLVHGLSNKALAYPSEAKEGQDSGTEDLDAWNPEASIYLSNDELTSTPVLSARLDTI